MALSIKKVLISDAVDASCVEILENNGIQVTLKTDFTKAQLLKEIENYDALIVRSATKVTSDVIEAGQKLKVIGRAGTGVDNIDCNAATRQGVLVINAPGGNTVSAAELTCAMVITLSREIPAATSSLKAGKWDRKMFMGNELYGKTLAIVGLGRIGKEVATRMQSFGMKTIGFDPIVPAEVSQEFGVESMTLDRLWPLADYITVHTPLIPQTKHLINKDTLGKCKKGVKIINVARGGIVHEDDLLAALESGHCGGAGLDVFVEEPPKNHALIGHPKVVCTPHLGANTREAQLRVAQEIAEQFVDLTVGQSVPGVVNAPALAQTQVPENKPWADLCVALGKVASALVGPSNGLQLELTTRGAALAGKAKFLCTAAAIGVLKQLGRSNANFINVSALAPEAKIEMLQKHVEKPSCCLSGEVSLDVKCGTTTHTLVGSVAGDRLFLCSIDGAAFEPRQVLSGALLFGVGQDSPNALVQIMGELVGQGISVLSASRCTGGFYVFSTGSPVSTQSRPPVAPLKFWSYVNFNN
ncbi:D-3-phosphoglycerate dehydrogenase-like [Ornithodoros turicata]|uniref:D-3-phosphoglycerate dehydrogenase-like n=1 Tax=Ornithodoros turicata TaxID=34597 RepID=UPI003138D9E1